MGLEITLFLVFPRGDGATASHTASYIFSGVVLNCAVVGVARRRSWIARAKLFDSIALKMLLLPEGSFFAILVRTYYLIYVRDYPSSSSFSYLLATAITNRNGLFD